MKQKRPFLERIDVDQPPDLQVDSMTADLKREIWDYLLYLFDQRVRHFTDNILEVHYIGICSNVFKLNLDSDTTQIPYYQNRLEAVRNWYFELNRSHYDIYALLDFIAGSPKIEDEHKQALNKLLEYHNAGFRVVNDGIERVTDKIEVDELNEAFKSEHLEDEVKAHLKSALKKLRKPHTDYRNSIKESISAVESKVKSGKNAKSKYGVAVNNLDIPESLKQVLHKLYGFASNEGGIRHGKKIGDMYNPSFAEAKLILAICTSIVNYLTLTEIHK